jgi:signal transduction histidine kinase
MEKDIVLNFSSPEYFSDELKHFSVLVDINKMSQVLRNLISNALKFSPRGSAVNIYTFLADKDESKNSNMKGYDGNKILRVEVHDSGPGISPVSNINIISSHYGYICDCIIVGKSKKIVL